MSLEANTLIAWVPVFAGIGAALVAVIGGAIAYRLQKNADAQSELVSKRRDMYEGLLKDFHLWISLNEKVTKSDDAFVQNDILNRQTISALLLASDSVAIEVGEFRRMLANAINATGDEKLEKFSKMLLAMRKDCFQESKLTEKEMSTLLPLQGNSERASKIIFAQSAQRHCGEKEK